MFRKLGEWITLCFWQWKLDIRSLAPEGIDFWNLKEIPTFSWEQVRETLKFWHALF